MFENALIQNPDAKKYAEETRAYQGCPTVAATAGGRLYAGWYAGGIFEPDVENYNLLVKSDDGGETWSDPLLVIEADREHFARAIDIQLFVDRQNTLYVFFTQEDYRRDTPPMYYDITAEELHSYFTINPHFGLWVSVCTNPDDARPDFSSPVRLCDGFLRAKPIETSDGRILVPAYNWSDEENYVYMETRDGFKTMKKCLSCKKAQNRVFDETVLCETEPSKLLLLARTNLGYYAKSVSADGGKSWSPETEFEKAPSSRLYFSRLENGDYLYVRNADDRERIGMKAILLDRRFEKKGELMLDSRRDVSYPDATVRDGYFYIVHDCERDNRCRGDREKGLSEAAKEILISKISLADLTEGRLHDGSYVSRILSKGKNNTFTVFKKEKD